MTNKQRRVYLKDYIPATYSLLFLGILLLIAYYYSLYRHGLWEKDVRSALMEELIYKKTRIEKSLSSRIYYSKSIAAFVSLNPQADEGEFINFAGKLIGNDSIINTLTISRGSITNTIYPQPVPGSTIEHRLPEYPGEEKLVKKSIASGHSFIAGPVQLAKGSRAFIVYTPIFVASAHNKKSFWGTTNLVIDQDRLLREAGFLRSNLNYKLALKGENGSGIHGSVFWGDSKIFEQNPVIITITLPTGSWQLATMPYNGWTTHFDQDKTLNSVLALSCFIISILFYLLLSTYLKVANSERQLKAVFRAMQSIIIELTDEGEYIGIPGTNKTLLYRDEKELIGKTLDDLVKPELATLLKAAIKQCLQTKQEVQLEYPHEFNGRQLWFSTRLSYKSNKRVILNAFDITTLKRTEENLRTSEQHQIELNALKDKFLSLTAHELRNPVGSFKMLTGIMLNEFEEVDPARTRKMLSSIHLASSSLLDLLENLLGWSHAQRKTLVITKRIENLFDLCDDAIDSQFAHAQVKGIRVENQVSNESLICCDPFISLTIIRNLLSNAIKFTAENGQIVVSNKQEYRQERYFQCVSVTDNGRGISQEQLQKINQSKASETPPGTSSETGTGLGLMLCREFVDKQDGFFEIISQVNHGTTVCFGLPFPDNFIFPLRAEESISCSTPFRQQQP